MLNWNMQVYLLPVPGDDVELNPIYIFLASDM